MVRSKNNSGSNAPIDSYSTPEQDITEKSNGDMISRIDATSSRSFFGLPDLPVTRGPTKQKRGLWDSQWADDEPSPKAQSDDSEMAKKKKKQSTITTEKTNGALSKDNIDTAKQNSRSTFGSHNGAVSENASANSLFGVPAPSLTHLLERDSGKDTQPVSDKFIDWTSSLFTVSPQRNSQPSVHHSADVARKDPGKPAVSQEVKNVSSAFDPSPHKTSKSKYEVKVNKKDVKEPHVSSSAKVTSVFDAPLQKGPSFSSSAPFRFSEFSKVTVQPLQDKPKMGPGSSKVHKTVDTTNFGDETKIKLDQQTSPLFNSFAAINLEEPSSKPNTTQIQALASPIAVKQQQEPIPQFNFTSHTQPQPPPSNPPMPSKPHKSLTKERSQYLKLHQPRDTSTSGQDEGLRTTPLLSLTVKHHASSRDPNITFPQYGFLGCIISDKDKDEDDEPALLNTNTPWSAFICGSQGSGKSYTLSAILEDCLYTSSRLGKLPAPLAAIVFSNSTTSSRNICEAAHLVSLGIKTTILVSRSNFHNLEKMYKEAVDHNPALEVKPLVLQSKHLNAESVYRLMAFGEGETTVPLYMEVIMRILREMAMEGNIFNYAAFKARLQDEKLQPAQVVMMAMRLNLLESFLDSSALFGGGKKSSRSTEDIFSTQPGTLTVVDLSDPFLDPSTTCTLFSIVHSLFLTQRPQSGLLIALDEAHKYLKATPAAEAFTDNLLTTIREQRHNGARVVVATQEPTISTKLLDLCSFTIVHRFTSPDWLGALRGHLAGASVFGSGRRQGDKSDTEDAESGVEEASGGENRTLFEKIVTLDVGESLLFAPSAMLSMQGDTAQKLGTGFVRFKTRRRLGKDGGESVLAVR